jgi:hypothetical protein
MSLFLVAILLGIGYSAEGSEGVPTAHAFSDYWTFIILPLARIIGTPLEPLVEIGTGPLLPLIALPRIGYP